MKKTTKYGILIFSVIILIGFALKRNITHEQFDSEKWKNWTETEQKMSMRWDMMNSLRKTHELKGKTEIEIIELLGIPENKYISEFSYYLGMAKHGIDTGHLTIYFDQNKNVSRIKVHRG
ncbi:hypothetical protein SHK09_03245 [Polaribacter sp. PL03]|uniref:hypothetical protein n=1 Tax=Polaribacter sp. PL03 TaxID=3088353 RepID=UPI0029CD160F|nr:hypothetical protein [Polaribacter sp. PL03]MDX6745795.1 hypothetical protein [Polaribacter sp. PL03]